MINLNLSGRSNAKSNRASTMVATMRSCRGHSLLEMLIVIALIGVLSSFALPQLIVQRRLMRSVGITRDLLTQLRETRQLSMSFRQAVTFEYNDATKRVRIINHRNNQPKVPGCNLSGTAILGAAGFPDTVCSQVIRSTPLAETAVSSEINYGIPNNLPNGALGDGIALTPLVNNRFTVTFQPDGSVVDATGNPDSRAIFFFNSRAASGTASAVSILGASGRVKIWRYSSSANLYTD